MERILRPLNELIAALPVPSWSDGKQWFDAGLALFRKHQIAWYGLALVLLFVISLSGSVPALGLVMMAFVSPLITAMWFAFLNIGGRTPTQRPRLFDAWTGIKPHLTALLLLGAVLLGLTLLTQWLNDILLGTLGLAPLDPENMQTITGAELFQRTVLNVAVNLPLVLVMTFSPALLLGVIDNVWSAMHLSALAVLKSWRAFIVVVLMLFLMVFAILLLASLVFSVLVGLFGGAGQALANVLVLMLVVLVMGVGMTVQFVAYHHLFQFGTKSMEEASPSQIEL